ncbi:MAG: hypothetical protein IJ257_01155 [Treponema sp.]|nr:hypothetical protein [Treponema sp.]
MSLNTVTKKLRLNEQSGAFTSVSGWDSKENLLPFKTLSDQDVITLINHALLVDLNSNKCRKTQMGKSQS